MLVLASELGEASCGAGTQASEEEGLASLLVSLVGKAASWTQLGLLGLRSVAEAKLTGTGSPPFRKGKQTGSVAEVMLPGTESQKKKKIPSRPLHHAVSF